MKIEDEENLARLSFDTTPSPFSMLAMLGVLARAILELREQAISSRQVTERI